MSRSRILQDRMSFLGYDAHCQKNLKELQPLLVPAIEGLLDDFYRFMHERPETRELLPNAEVLAKARLAQKEHWLQLLSGEDLGEAHCARAIQIGRAHERIGLGLSAYLGGYCIVLNRFIELIAAQYQDDALVLSDKIQSIQKAVFLDVDFVIESYTETKNTSIRKILRHAEQFIAEIEQIDSELAVMGGGLKPKVETLAASFNHSRKQLDILREVLPLGGEGQASLGQMQRLQAAFARCEESLNAVSEQCQTLSAQLERLNTQVAARKTFHKLNFGTAPSPGFPSRLKTAARILFKLEEKPL